MICEWEIVKKTRINCRNDNSSRHTLYTLSYTTRARVRAHVPHVHRPFASCEKVFYYFIIERVCQYIAFARE